jgi:thiamine-phosphate pyrophosphorylase
MLRYAITDRAVYAGTENYRLDSVVREAERWAADGIDFVQIREKDLNAGELAELTRRIMAAVRVAGTVKTRVLVNSRADVSVAAGADGVHLTAATGELTPVQVRRVFEVAGMGVPVVSASCHSIAEAERARDAGVDLILFGPVFEKRVGRQVIRDGEGLEALRRVSSAVGGVKVLALGGVTMELAEECIEAGAAGVAGIRLFLRGAGELKSQSGGVL